MITITEEDTSMRTLIRTMTLIFIMSTLFGCASTATRDTSPNIRGAWKVTQTQTRPVGGTWTDATPVSSLYLFTDTHYSYMLGLGPAPRRLFAGDPNRPTPEEKIAAYDSFVAASGRYVLSGSTLTLTASLHKNPNEMAGQSLTFNATVGADQLEIMITNPPFAPGFERRTVLTRIE